MVNSGDDDGIMDMLENIVQTATQMAQEPSACTGSVQVAACSSTPSCEREPVPEPTPNPDVNAVPATHTPMQLATQPPRHGPVSSCFIVGPWRTFTGRGNVHQSGLKVPSQASFSSLSYIASGANRLQNKTITNISGIVETIYPLALTNTEPHWKLQLRDLIHSDERCYAYMFPARGVDLDLGTRLPGLKTGDLILDRKSVV